VINMAALDREDEERRKLIAGFRAFDYTGDKCKNCGRNRVMNCVNGRHVCEKCNWDAADTRRNPVGD